jgi:ABC-type sugar transport system substrate-binding protein
MSPSPRRLPPLTTEARIPMIAIDIPHPGATYFGANNYGAGLLAGRLVRRHLSPAEGSATHGQPAGHAFYRLAVTIGNVSTVSDATPVVDVVAATTWATAISATPAH